MYPWFFFNLFGYRNRDCLVEEHAYVSENRLSGRAMEWSRRDRLDLISGWHSFMSKRYLKNKQVSGKPDYLVPNVMHLPGNRLIHMTCQMAVVLCVIFGRLSDEDVHCREWACEWYMYVCDSARYNRSLGYYHTRKLYRMPHTISVILY